MDEIQQLQVIEQNFQSVLMQKQQMQQQLLEAENGITELESSGKCYRIIGTIMVEADAKSIKKELETKRDELTSRMKIIEKHEAELRSKMSELQKKAMKGMEDGSK